MSKKWDDETIRLGWFFRLNLRKASMKLNCALLSRSFIALAFCGLVCQAVPTGASSEEPTVTEAKDRPTTAANDKASAPRNAALEAQRSKAGLAAKAYEPAPQACTPSSFTGFVPPSGCACKATWSYNGKTICNQQCATPDGDATPWCYTQQSCNGNTWAYCSAPAKQ